MAFANYINNTRGDRARLQGQFQENEHRNWFEYFERNTIDRESFAPDYLHRIFVTDDGDTRIGMIKKTVAYVVTDIDMQGNLVVEKWKLNKNNLYSA